MEGGINTTGAPGPSQMKIQFPKRAGAVKGGRRREVGGLKKESKQKRIPNDVVKRSCSREILRAGGETTIFNYQLFSSQF